MKTNIGQNFRFLLCNIAGDSANPSSPEEEWVSSPLRCLETAIDRQPEIVVIFFGRIPIRDRKYLVELCSSLKRNNHTKNLPVLALLNLKHGKLMEELDKVKVDYARYIGDARITSNTVREIIADLSHRDRLEQNLKKICFFLRYSNINPKFEMTTCAAYFDRMVLGGRRLRELCQTEAHLHCEYFKNPKIKS